MAKLFNLTVDFKTPTINTENYDEYMRVYNGVCRVTDAVGYTAMHDYDVKAIYDHDAQAWNVGVVVYFGRCPLVVAASMGALKTVEDVERYIKETYLT